MRTVHAPSAPGPAAPWQFAAPAGTVRWDRPAMTSVLCVCSCCCPASASCRCACTVPATRSWDGSQSLTRSPLSSLRSPGVFRGRVECARATSGALWSW